MSARLTEAERSALEWVQAFGDRGRLACLGVDAHERIQLVLDATQRIIAARAAAPAEAGLAEAWERGAFAGREYQKSLSRWDRVVSPPEHAPNPYTTPLHPAPAADGEASR